MSNTILHPEIKSIETYGSEVAHEMKLTQEQVHQIISVFEVGDISRHVADKVTLTYLLLIKLRDKILSSRVYVDHSESLSDVDYMAKWMNTSLPMLGGITPLQHLMLHGELGYNDIYLIA